MVKFEFYEEGYALRATPSGLTVGDQGEKGIHRWRAVAENGEPIAASGEGFTERNDAVESVERLIEAIQRGDVEYG